MISFPKVFFQNWNNKLSFWIVRYASASLMSKTASLTDFNYKPKITTEEQEKVLSILNQPNKEELLKFNVSKSKIKSFETYKKKRGPFRSLSDVLEVDGLSVKILEKLCNQIIGDATAPDSGTKKTVVSDKEGATAKNVSGSDFKRVRQFIVPLLAPDTVISSSVGIHLAPMGMSWAKLDSGHTLQSWGYEDFAALPKKMLPTDTFDLALNVIPKIPVGDVYVFEGAPSMGLPGQKQQSAVTSYTQQLELTSMLLALINTSCILSKHTENDKESLDIRNKVYFLRSKLPARLFKTLLGNECVSTMTIITQLLEGGALKPSEFPLPCTPIVVEEKLKRDYFTQLPGHKELLGHALMLAISFMDLCVKRTPVSLKAVAPGNSKNTQ